MHKLRSNGRFNPLNPPPIPEDAAVTLTDFRRTLRELYEGATPQGVRFRYALLAFDIVTVLFIVATSFLPRDRRRSMRSMSLFGVLILADFVARLFISQQPAARPVPHPSTWADIVAIVSFLAPLVGEAGGFLRILRTLRLLRTYQLLARLRSDIGFFRRNEEVIFAVANLVGVHLRHDRRSSTRRSTAAIRRSPTTPTRSTSPSPR